MKINQWKDSVGDKGNLQGKWVNKNKTEIPEPSRGLATSAQKYKKYTIYYRLRGRKIIYSDRGTSVTD